ncbi:MAG: hypothetical protein HRT47_00145 [Candidatus Caenarcaniphilales bacterium]|nr:hypothetical protein [Candidatus Caenarcaniphilales bacterium]
MFINPNKDRTNLNYLEKNKVTIHKNTVKKSKQPQKIDRISQKPDYPIKSPITMFEYINLANIYGTYANTNGEKNDLITKSLEEGVTELSLKMNNLYQLKQNLEKQFNSPMKIALLTKSSKEPNEENYKIVDLDVFDAFIRTLDSQQKHLPIGFDPDYSNSPQINIDSKKGDKLLKTLKNDPNLKNNKQTVESYIKKLILAFHNLQESMLDHSNGNFEEELIIAPVTNYPSGPIFHLESALNIWNIFGGNNFSSNEYLNNKKDEINLKVQTFKEIKKHIEEKDKELCTDFLKAKEKFM